MERKKVSLKREKEVRSRNMAAIKSSNTKSTERALENLLRHNHFRFSRKSDKLLGKPDFILKKTKTVIFTDGCFWHKCPKCYRNPRNNKIFWQEKINNNVKRDKKVNKLLKQEGWKVLRFWEHDIIENPEKVLKKISKEFNHLANKE